MTEICLGWQHNVSNSGASLEQAFQVWWWEHSSQEEEWQAENKDDSWECAVGVRLAGAEQETEFAWHLWSDWSEDVCCHQDHEEGTQHQPQSRQTGAHRTHSCSEEHQETDLPRQHRSLMHWWHWSGIVCPKFGHWWWNLVVHEGAWVQIWVNSVVATQVSASQEGQIDSRKQENNADTVLWCKRDPPDRLPATKRDHWLHQVLCNHLQVEGGDPQKKTKSLEGKAILVASWQRQSTHLFWDDRQAEWVGSESPPSPPKLTWPRPVQFFIFSKTEDRVERPKIWHNSRTASWDSSDSDEMVQGCVCWHHARSGCSLAKMCTSGGWILRRRQCPNWPTLHQRQHRQQWQLLGGWPRLIDLTVFFVVPLPGEILLMFSMDLHSVPAWKILHLLFLKIVHMFLQINPEDQHCQKNPLLQNARAAET